MQLSVTKLRGVTARFNGSRQRLDAFLIQDSIHCFDANPAGFFQKLFLSPESADNPMIVNQQKLIIILSSIVGNHHAFIQLLGNRAQVPDGWHHIAMGGHGEFMSEITGV